LNGGVLEEGKNGESNGSILLQLKSNKKSRPRPIFFQEMMLCWMQVKRGGIPTHEDTLAYNGFKKFSSSILLVVDLVGRARIASVRR